MGWFNRCDSRRPHSLGGFGFRGSCAPAHRSHHRNSFWRFWNPRPTVYVSSTPAIRVAAYPTRVSPEAAAITTGIFLAVLGACLAPVTLGGGLALTGLGIVLIAGGIAGALTKG